ncbi:MAG TPA: hypothetical protein VKT72_15720 [Candidatus Baltobacteraceae bacterium]|nr:hypothetical protein [Candidatus Baltobacteraceae bacterium]
MRIRVACLLLLIGSAGCSQTCVATFDYAQRPVGYHWQAFKAPQSANTVYYGVDPSNGWTVYVGPDSRYYTYPHRGKVQAADLHSTWCPHGVGEPPATQTMLTTLAASLAAIFSHKDHLTTYDYLHRPAGYGWKPRRSKATGAVVYYGIDPTDGWTVYVGPDNQYYTFPHGGDILPSDLTSTWDPHRAPNV